MLVFWLNYLSILVIAMIEPTQKLIPDEWNVLDSKFVPEWREKKDEQDVLVMV